MISPTLRAAAAIAAPHISNKDFLAELRLGLLEEGARDPDALIAALVAFIERGEATLH